MSFAVRHERVCWLEGNLKRFEPLWWWLDYWGDWAASGTGGARNVLAVMMQLAEEGFLDRSTAMDGYPGDIAVLERCLAKVRTANRFHFKLMTQAHIGKLLPREMAGGYGIRKRGLDRALWHAYSAVDAAFLEFDPVLRSRQAPSYCRT